jgi:hypothetical protein
MSTETKAVSTTEASPPADAGSGLQPTVTHYQQLKDEISTSVQQAMSRIPLFVETHPSTTKFVRTHQNFSTEFIATAVAAVESSAELQGVNMLDVAATRDALQFVDAFRPFVDELTSMAANLKFTLDTRKAQATIDALTIYAVAKSVARAPQSTQVAAHVQNLRRDIRRNGPKRKKAQPPSSPTPSPTTGHTTSPTTGSTTMEGTPAGEQKEVQETKN